MGHRRDCVLHLFSQSHITCGLVTRACDATGRMQLQLGDTEASCLRACTVLVIILTLYASLYDVLSRIGPTTP